ncbi:MAG: TonB-dependent receptor [Bacteroidota bacterium]|nr:TonB-dependent receptor [Bacteroidota bacterium]
MSARRLLAVLALALVLCVPDSAAQMPSVVVRADSLALEVALKALAEGAKIDIVYAERQVRDRRVSCNYAGESVQDALDCLLEGQGLLARRLERRRQYVIAWTEASPAQAEPTPVLGFLRGYARDAASGGTLPGTNIYLPDLRLGTASNEAGYFAMGLLPAIDYRVRISFLGFLPVDTLLTASGEAVHHIELTPVTLIADELVVQSDRSDIRRIEPGVRQVPVGAIQMLPGLPGEPDLLQSLRWLPSVQKAGTGEGGLFIRGGQPDQNLYLIDGAPLYHPWHAFSLLSVFQSETFRNVDLYQGTFPAEFGGRLSAVLDAELKDGNRERAAGLAAIGVLSGRFVLEGPLGPKVSAMVSGRRSFIDRILGSVHPLRVGSVLDTMRTGLYLYDLSGKITWLQSARHRLAISAYTGSDVFDIRLPFTISLPFDNPLDIKSWLRPSSLVFELDTRWSNRLISTRQQYLHSDRFFVTATVYRSEYRAREQIYVRPVESSRVTSNYSVLIKDTGLMVDVDYYPAATHKVRAGLKMIRRSFDSGLDALVLRTATSYDRLDDESQLKAFELVAFAQDTWQPTRKLQIQPGVRFSLLDVGSGLKLSPRLGLRYQISRKLAIRAASGTNVQYMHRIRDRYSFLYDLMSYRWVPASRSVKPSTSAHVSAGGIYFPASGAEIHLDAYWHSTLGLLLPRDQYQTKDGLEGPGIALGALLGQYTRGDALAYGLEANLHWERGRYLVWASYTAARSYTRAPGLGETSYRPARFDAPQRLQAAVQRRLGAWTLTATGYWRSGYPVTVPVARYAVGDPLEAEPTRFLVFPNINNGRLPPYVRYGTSVAYEFGLFQRSTARLQAQLYNLTLRRNIVDRVYAPQAEESVEVITRRGLPLIPLFEFMIRF